MCPRDITCYVPSRYQGEIPKGYSSLNAELGLHLLPVELLKRVVERLEAPILHRSSRAPYSLHYSPALAQLGALHVSDRGQRLGQGSGNEITS